MASKRLFLVSAGNFFTKLSLIERFAGKMTEINQPAVTMRAENQKVALLCITCKPGR